MKLVLDESIEKQIADALKNQGYKVCYILDMERGINDEKVLETANSGNALLITADKDFGELVFRRKMISSGIVLLRLFGLSNHEKTAITIRLMKEHGDEFMHAFTVITEKTIRIRKFNP